MPLPLDPSFASPVSEVLTVPPPKTLRLAPAVRVKAPVLSAKVAPVPTFHVWREVSDIPLAMLTVPLDKAEALMPDDPRAIVPPVSEAG
jgi:hypothetical protein